MRFTSSFPGKVAVAGLAAGVIAAGVLSTPAPAMAQTEAQAYNRSRYDRVIVPTTSMVFAEDRGIRAHTNHFIHFRPFANTGAPSGETPASISAVYHLPQTGGSGVIAIVDAFHYGTGLSDFNVFSSQFGLATEVSTNPTASSNKVFQIVYASGRRPAANAGWNQEAALDIEWAHAMAPGAKIILVEAASSSFTDLFTAVRAASNIPGVREISMSWGGSEFNSEVNYDAYFTKAGMAYIASSGDTGGAMNYPAASPNVICAGGTRINRNSSGLFINETGWSGSGGGLSPYESRPASQNVISGIVGAQRGIPDISFDADPASGVAVYDSTPNNGASGWLVFGGTSVSAPSLAGIFNTAATARGNFAVSSQAELSLIYGSLGNAANITDIIGGMAGNNTAVTGWDYVTGVGSVLGIEGK